ncbi:MAG: hypothetical protein IPJ34_26940 [Myxococcales bacterium]|nr:hypothetical protein [Myxococcales bacterium]
MALGTERHEHLPDVRVRHRDRAGQAEDGGSRSGDERREPGQRLARWPSASTPECAPRGRRARDRTGAPPGPAPAVARRYTSTAGRLGAGDVAAGDRGLEKLTRPRRAGELARRLLAAGRHVRGAAWKASVYVQLGGKYVLVPGGWSEK